MVLIDKYNDLKRNYEEVKDIKKDKVDKDKEKGKSSSNLKFHVTSSSKSTKNVADLGSDNRDASSGFSLGTGLNGLLNNRRQSIQSSRTKNGSNGFQVSKIEYKILPDYNYNYDRNGLKYSDRVSQDQIKEYEAKLVILQGIADSKEEKAIKFTNIEKEFSELKEKVIILEKEKAESIGKIVELKDSVEKMNEKYQKYKCKYIKFQSDEEKMNTLQKQLEELKIKSESEIRRIKKNEQTLGVHKIFNIVRIK